MTMIAVLDKGYVQLVSSYGTELDIVNTARASFAKASTFDEHGALRPADLRLLRMLVRRREFSCVRCCCLTFGLRMPLFVARQLYKYSVGATWRDEQFQWNESSRRYVTDEPEFYLPGPNEWRRAPENRKQGSGDPLPAEDGWLLTAALASDVETGLRLYRWALSCGVAPEQARGFLNGYFLYVTARVTLSLHAVIHLLEERLPHDAQAETHAYARAILALASERYPNVIGAAIESEKEDTGG